MAETATRLEFDEYRYIQVVQMTRATIEVRYFFLILPLNLGAQDLSQNTDLEKNKKLLPYVQSCGLGTRREVLLRKTKGRNSDGFGLRAPSFTKGFGRKLLPLA